MSQGPIVRQAYGLNAFVPVFPEPIVTTRNPVNGQDTGLAGQVWVNSASNDAFVNVNASTSTWVGVGGGAGNFTNLTVAPGPTALSGQFTVTSGTNAVNIAADTAANTVNIATGGAAKAANFGSTNTTSTTTVQSGTGGANVTSTGLTTISSSRANANAINITASAATGGIVLSAATATIVQSFLSTGATIALTDLPWTLTTGTQTVGISTDNTSNTIDIGTGGAASVKTVVVGCVNNNSITTLQSGTGGTVITTAPTGTISIGNDNTAKTINIGAGATGTNTIAIGSSNAGTLTLNTVATTSGVSINNGATSASIFVGSAAPNGAVTGTDGSIYLRTGTATASTVLYVCTGGTTWTAVTVP